MNKKIMLLSVQAPETADPTEAMIKVSEDIFSSQGASAESGYCLLEGQEAMDDDISWSLITSENLEKIDPRQKEAAAALLMAFDLPIDILSASAAMLLASSINPGAKIGSMGSSNRLDQLNRAKELIDQMLEEISNAA